MKRESVVSSGLIDYRDTEELRALIASALKHDATVFKETRAEHASREALGSPQRYKPITPIIVTALLAGLREKELLALEWPDVHLEEQRIHVHRTASSTKRARQVDLSITPPLAELLRGVVKGIPATARTLEDAMGIAKEVKRAILSLKSRPTGRGKPRDCG